MVCVDEVCGQCSKIRCREYIESARDVVRRLVLIFAPMSSNPVFRFKQFAVWQDRTPMKVGTDGVLLGCLASHPHPQGVARCLDIGAGTGLVSLMLAQRFPKAAVTGVEIDAEAAGQATENCTASPFA
ncbi:methyltransferase, partial [Salmonella enterica]|nr:methyltransferase [Salmonella enterica]